MEWNWRDEESYSEMMADYEMIEPSIEAMSARDAEIAALRSRLSRLEQRVRELPQPLPQFRTGSKNPLLNAVRNVKGARYE